MDTLQTPVLEWREAVKDEEPFLIRIAHTTVGESMKEVWGLAEEQQIQFLERHVTTLPWWIASVEGQDVGTLSYLVNQTGIFVQSLHVLPEWQRRGIGTAMMQMLFDRAAPHHMPIELHVFQTNTGGLRFYERLGFIRTKKSENGFWMQKNFPVQVPSIFALIKGSVLDLLPSRSSRTKE